MHNYYGIMPTSHFYIRRMTHESLVHMWDAETAENEHISVDGDIEDLFLKGFNFEGRYRLQTGFLNPTGDSHFQDINQYFVSDQHSELIRLKDIE